MRVLSVSKAISKRSRTFVDVAGPARESSIWDNLTARTSMPWVPLNTPSVKFSPPATAPAAGQVKITTLENGLRVASVDHSGPISSVSVFVDAGSRHDDFDSNGLSHFLQQLALKSTKHRTDFRLSRNFSEKGANVQCNAGREHIMYSAEVLREYSPEVVELLGDIVKNPAFELLEVEEAKEQYIAQLEELTANEGTQITEAIHAAAYPTCSLGLSLYGPKRNLELFTPERLRAHVAQNFVGSRLVVTGVNLAHDDLVNLTRKALGTVPRGNPAKPSTRYTGGEVRKNADTNGFVHLALGFESPNWNSSDVVASCVLQTMMGGGGSFSAGGPGKGMYSRLYENVLNSYGWVESATTFNHIYSDTGLFGFYGIAQASKAAQLVDVLSKEFIGVTGKIDEIELKRAKNQLKSSIYFQLESRAIQVEDLGRQVLTYGKVIPPQEIASLIEAVTVKDIQNVARNLLKKPVSVAAYGEIAQVPQYSQIAQGLKQ